MRTVDTASEWLITNLCTAKSFFFSIKAIGAIIKGNHNNSNSFFYVSLLISNVTRSITRGDNLFSNKTKRKTLRLPLGARSDTGTPSNKHHLVPE